MSAPLRVVLVDDAPEVRRLLRTALRLRGGFEVVGEAESGTRAVTLIADLKPDLVVLDLGLPDLAGREVLGRMRLHSPRSKVVVFSGGEPLDHTWIAERADGFVVKDAELDYLLDLMEKVGADALDSASLELPQEPSSPGRARRFVRETLTSWRQEAVVDDALIVVSEMVTNAITHASSSCRLRLSLRPAVVRVEVVDGGAGTPDVQPPSATEEHGRGLHLIAGLTTAWGLDDACDGKLVWADLPRTP